MITNPDLARLADHLGVTLRKHDRGPKGVYRHRGRVISTRRGLSVAAYKSTLAHELGHAYFGDVPTGNTHFDSRQEARADRFAARLLLDPSTVEDTLRWHQGRVGPAAYDLEVTRHLLTVYLDHSPCRSMS